MCFDPFGCEYVGLIIAVDLNFPVLHGDECFRHPVQTQPSWHLTPDVIGLTHTGQIKRKPLIVLFEQFIFRRQKKS